MRTPTLLSLLALVWALLVPRLGFADGGPSPRWPSCGWPERRWRMSSRSVQLLLRESCSSRPSPCAKGVQQLQQRQWSGVRQ